MSIVKADLVAISIIHAVRIYQCSEKLWTAAPCVTEDSPGLPSGLVLQCDGDHLDIYGISLTDVAQQIHRIWPKFDRLGHPLIEGKEGEVRFNKEEVIYGDLKGAKTLYERHLSFEDGPCLDSEEIHEYLSSVFIDPRDVVDLTVTDLQDGSCILFVKSYYNDQKPNWGRVIAFDKVTGHHKRLKAEEVEDYVHRTFPQLRAVLTYHLGDDRNATILVTKEEFDESYPLIRTGFPSAIR